jgi:hypothetical protein
LILRKRETTHEATVVQNWAKREAVLVVRLL